MRHGMHASGVRDDSPELTEPAGVRDDGDEQDEQAQREDRSLYHVVDRVHEQPAERGVRRGEAGGECVARIHVTNAAEASAIIDQAHAAVEFVECAEVEQAFQFYRMFMLSFV